MNERIGIMALRALRARWDSESHYWGPQTYVKLQEDWRAASEETQRDWLRQATTLKSCASWCYIMQGQVHDPTVPPERVYGMPLKWSTFQTAKADRVAFYWRWVHGWVLEKCTACNGSGRYDHNGSPRCGACEGEGKTRRRGPKALLP